MRQSIEFIQESLLYCRTTGTLAWRERPESHFKSSIIHKRWNSRYAGKITGSPDNKGYLRINIRGYPYLAHHLAWVIHYGEWPKTIDHINRNPSDNRLENLRHCTLSQNQHNRDKCVSNKSGYKGVSLHKLTGRWRASIYFKSKQHYLGLFDDPKDAHAAYCEAAERLHSGFANFGSVPVAAAE